MGICMAIGQDMDMDIVDVRVSFHNLCSFRVSFYSRRYDNRHGDGHGHMDMDNVNTGIILKTNHVEVTKILSIKNNHSSI